MRLIKCWISNYTHQAKPTANVTLRAGEEKTDDQEFEFKLPLSHEVVDAILALISTDAANEVSGFFEALTGADMPDTPKEETAQEAFLSVVEEGEEEGA